ncbi:MAG: FAD-binding protein [Fimbriimonadaceae bacterium]|nr:FAD-binding protein [Fimbriimonadaceae bacterium]
MSRIRGLGTKQGFLCLNDSWESPIEDAGIVEFRSEDQIVVARAGTPIAELQAALRERGQCLPLPTPDEWGPQLAGYPGTVGGLVAAHLPHGLEASHGPVRDWVLGATFQRPDGRTAKSGSRVVKSVAGYDIHRAACGTWGQGLRFVEVTFRTTALRGLQPVRAHLLKQHDGPVYITRCLPTAFADLKERAREPLAYCEDTSTIWSLRKPELNEPGWIVGPGGDWTRPISQSDVVERWRNVWDTGCRWS